MDITDNEISWQALYSFVCACGNVHDPKGFGIEILRQLPAICAFDQAGAFFLNGSGNVSSQHLVNINKKWASLYHEYYSTLYDGRYKIPLHQNAPVNDAVQSDGAEFCDWTQAMEDEFVTDFIRERGVTYSLSFKLTDPAGLVRTFIVLERTGDRPFSKLEQKMLSLVVPQLNNLYRNFFTTRRIQYQDISKVTWDGMTLTEREKEVSDLLCQGLSPDTISRRLHIAQSTAYKHIANIYKKLHVSNRQELLVRLLRR